MFNLPWYSWFNVMAIPCLWGLLSLNSAMASRPAWLGKVLRVQILAAITTIFLYWNPAISDGLLPLHYALILLVLPLLIWNIGAVVLDLLQIAWVNVKLLAKPQMQRVPEPETPPVLLHGNDIDLDGGESPLLREKEIGEAVSSLFSSHSSAATRVGSIGKLFGEPDDEEFNQHGRYYVMGLLIYGFAIAIVLMPVAYMTLSMAGMFQNPGLVR